ncbi:hypothetical protein FQR65_LT12214 [Abscondita terminalis]|nr:hypothetical protein FQR65_LT12214 [Abscondita terminalis]
MFAGITIRCSGQSGHGSLLLSNTPGEKVRLLLDKIYDFRDQQIQKLNDDSNLTLGDVTSINLTMLQGGVQPNVIPQEFVMDMDCRIPLTTDITKWEEIVNQWCKESGEGVRVEYKSKPTHSPVTELVDSNYFWMVFRKTFAEIGLKMKTAIFPAGTDSDCLRKIGIPCLSFSPICNTPILLHDHNEHLNMNVFLRGIEIYTKILTAIATV